MYATALQKSVLRYKFLIMDTYHPDTSYLCEQECEDPWLFFATKRGPRAAQFGKHCFIYADTVIVETITYGSNTIHSYDKGDKFGPAQSKCTYNLSINVSKAACLRGKIEEM
jgi:hypothetical protein